MRTLPRLSYCGLTVVLSNPSRMDTRELLSGYEGKFFNEECLYPSVNRYQCDIRTSDTLAEGLLANTKCLLLLGERSFQEWTGGLYKEYTLNEQRGCPLKSSIDFLPPNISIIASYTPRDCVDATNWERKLNPLNNYESPYTETKEDDEEETSKTKGKTAWKNYGFWLRQDTKNILTRLLQCYDEVRPKQSPIYRIYPNSTEIINELISHKNDSLYLDIETDSSLNIFCIGVAFTNGPIYVIPWIRCTNYQPAYSDIHKIYRALCVSFLHNETVIHNSQFDLLVLVWKYHMLVGRRQYDTMLAWHRLYPEAEKSLGHVMSALTNEPYHKDEGIFMPQNSKQERQLWEYNGKDVYGMRLCRLEIDRIASGIPGMAESIKQSNTCIRPYLINTLQGIRYSAEAMNNIISNNDRIMTQYLRVMRTLLGAELFSQIKGKSQANIATSSKMAIEYFHHIMNYDVVSKTPEKKPSLNADAMYKLKLKYSENPMIDFILKYRERAKESSMLKFAEWKGIGI